MLRKLVTVFVLAPLAIILVMFAVANREVVTVSFDPFNAAQPAFAMRMPLFVLIIVLLMLGVLIGGIASWLRQGRWRRSVRRLDADRRALRAELERLRRQGGPRPAASTYSSGPPAVLRPPAA